MANALVVVVLVAGVEITEDRSSRAAISDETREYALRLSRER